MCPVIFELVLTKASYSRTSLARNRRSLNHETQDTPTLQPVHSCGAGTLLKGSGLN